ncbi:MAG: sulfotransferase family protein [bacterium]|nr:sulfotransferase family protein [bacterium]
MPLIQYISKLLQRHRSHASSDGQHIEFVSIHIPKTAGTSFRNILKQVYGKQRVIRIDITLPGEKNSFRSPFSPPEKLPNKARVIHGHFRFPDLADLYHLSPDIPIITWVRDPVERVISNYCYLQKMLCTFLREEQRQIDILSKMERTLPEYARTEINRNRMAKFLEGIRLRDLLFVGIQEDFSKELDDLVTLLNWERVTELRHNSSRAQHAPVSGEIEEEIRRLNQQDIELYQQALRLREERQQRLRGAV